MDMTSIRLALLAIVLQTSGVIYGAESADSRRGEQMFETESCVQCHSIQGKGGKTGPDLGARLDRGYTPVQLAAVIWNHAPVMWTAMRLKSIRPPEINEQAAADLFAYFYSVRYFENPGDAGRGKQIFASKHCSDCHGITSSNAVGAPPVKQWQALGEPIALADAMWNHSARMRDAFAVRKLPWPELTGQDLSDLLVYLRNLPETRGLAVRFDTASNLNGGDLFQSKNCAGCHHGSLDLTSRLNGKSLTGIAAAMWSHAPKMAKATIELQPGEMRAILIYLWSQQLFHVNGNPGRGEKVFAAKNCAACHNNPSSGAPNLASKKGSFSPVSMVSVLWRHGPSMLEKMQSKNMQWPRFKEQEMSDLIAYLNSGK
jgi:mono/diheme cytochrome c family protein